MDNAKIRSRIGPQTLTLPTTVHAGIQINNTLCYYSTFYRCKQVKLTKRINLTFYWDNVRIIVTKVISTFPGQVYLHNKQKVGNTTGFTLSGLVRNTITPSWKGRHVQPTPPTSLSPRDTLQKPDYQELTQCPKQESFI